MFLYDLYPFAVAVGLALLALSFVLPDAAAVMILRILSVVAFVFAIIAAFPVA